MLLWFPNNNLGRENQVMKKLFLYLLILYYDIESLMLRLVKSKRQSDTLILRTDNIGDFILWLDSASEIRKRLNGRITLLCSSAVASFAKNIAYFDEIQTIDTKKFFFNPIYRFKLLKKLKVQSYDLILNPVFSRDYFIGDSIVRNVVASKKIGFGQNYKNTESRFAGLLKDKKQRKQLVGKLLSKSSSFYTSLIESEAGNKMELKRNAEFVSGFFVCKFKSSLPESCFSLPEFEVKDNYVVVFVGASQVKKNWGGRKFLQLIESINCSVVLCGGSGDCEISDYVMKRVSQPGKVMDFVGKTSLLELCSIIQKSRFVISNDTMATHLAAMLRVRSIVICPGHHKMRFHPYDTDVDSKELKQYFPILVQYEMDCFDCGGVCIHTKSKTECCPCIENVSVEMVMVEVNKLLC